MRWNFDSIVERVPSLITRKTSIMVNVFTTTLLPSRYVISHSQWCNTVFI